VHYISTSIFQEDNLLTFMHVSVCVRVCVYIYIYIYNAKHCLFLYHGGLSLCHYLAKEAIEICDLSDNAIYLHIISERHIFEKVIEYKMRVLVFTTNLCPKQ
jgi:hypothetical protein